jgi:hypothetical protein
VTTIPAPLPALDPDPRWARSRGRRAAAVPFALAPAGYCRWCGHDLGARLRSGDPDPRKRWHPACVTAMQALDHGALRVTLWERELGVCETCGRFCPWLRVPREHRDGTSSYDGPLYRAFEVDHIVPLEDGGAHEIANLQLLCAPCHTAKTARENHERAVRRRETRVVAA